MRPLKTGFIGAGRMGAALINGLLKAGVVSKDGMLAYDADPARLRELRVKGIKTAGDNGELVLNSDTIFIAVKPKDVAQVLEEISEVSEGKLFVSIAAGVSTRKLEEKLAGRVIRVMPNTPCMAYQGASAFALGSKATKRDAQRIKKMLETLGTAIQLKEELLDAATGLSGSGPAYVYYFIKAMAEAGEEEGLKREDALRLAAQTAKGAAEMVLSAGKTPQQLIDDVCSPGGTTIEGLRVLEERKVADAIKQAVEAAARRSRDLSV
jgi:pyrroline-5-carboxylate reductase